MEPSLFVPRERTMLHRHKPMDALSVTVHAEWWAVHQDNANDEPRSSMNNHRMATYRVHTALLHLRPSDQTVAASAQS